ncbi:MAG: hypothetical protein L3J25_09145 [Flavobacteriaceae bacterium]|nr:hypothetical protein [Flavobacteriaceae bacterium]
MKLVIITAVEEFHNDLLQIFKKAEIKNVSESEIDGYKNIPTVLTSSNWFGNKKEGVDSIMLFSFTEKEKIDTLFDLLETYNKNLKTNNPVKAVVLPIERFI